MNYRVSVTQIADRESDDAYLWWAKHRSAEQARRWYRKYLCTLVSLRIDLERYGVAPESSEYNETPRELTFGVGRRKTHRVVFTIIGDTVEVLAVRHLAPDSAPLDEV